MESEIWRWANDTTCSEVHVRVDTAHHCTHATVILLGPTAHTNAQKACCYYIVSGFDPNVLARVHVHAYLALIPVLVGQLG